MGEERRAALVSQVCFPGSSSTETPSISAGSLSSCASVSLTQDHWAKMGPMLSYHSRSDPACLHTRAYGIGLRCCVQMPETSNVHAEAWVLVDASAVVGIQAHACSRPPCRRGVPRRASLSLSLSTQPTALWEPIPGQKSISLSVSDRKDPHGGKSTPFFLSLRLLSCLSFQGGKRQVCVHTRSKTTRKAAPALDPQLRIWS